MLHISDLHMRAADGPQASRVRLEAASRWRVLGETWMDNLAELRKDGVAFDLVVFTGDLGDWGHPTDYPSAVAFLRDTCAALGVPLDRLFVIPGNHDIDRSIQRAAWESLRCDITREPHAYSTWMAGGDPAALRGDPRRDQIRERQQAFWAAMARAGRPELAPDRSPHRRLGYRQTVTLPGLMQPIHVIGLDTAWLAGDALDSGALWLTEHQVALLTTTADGAPLPGFRLALMHHRLADLADAADSRKLLADRIDVLLHGHQHDPASDILQGPDHRLLVLTTGCLYEGDEGHRYANACQVIDLTLDEQARPQRAAVRFRAWSQRSYFWGDDALLYRNTRRGRLSLHRGARGWQFEEPPSAAEQPAAPSQATLEAIWRAETEEIRRKTQYIQIVGCNVRVPPVDALSLYVSPSGDGAARAASRANRRFEARYLADHEAPRAIVFGTPGIGKSTVLKIIAAHLVASGKRVLLGSLRQVARLMDRGNSFGPAAVNAACRVHHEEAEAAELLGGADAILLDGLDETARLRSAVIEGLEQWAARLPAARWIITTRPVPEVPSLLPSFQPFALSLPGGHQVGPFVERVTAAMGHPGAASNARARVLAATSARPDLATPLLLGFLTSLAVAGDHELVSTPALLYQRVLTLIARSDRAERRYVVDMNAVEAEAVLEELAWARHVDRDADSRELMARIADGLGRRRLADRDPQLLSERGIEFWEERAVVTRVLRAARDDLEFVHAILQDFAAGRCLSRRPDADVMQFAANAAIPGDVEVLSVAASLRPEASAAIVEGMLAGVHPDPDRILACSYIVEHAAPPEPIRARLVVALTELIRCADIPTHAADAGRALAQLVDVGLADVSRARDAVGDHRKFEEDARRLAVLRVRIACAAKGAEGAVSPWILEELAAHASDEHRFHERAFSARAYLDELLPAAVRTVALQEGDRVAAELIRRLYADGNLSGNASMAILVWAYDRGDGVLRDAVDAGRSEWEPTWDQLRDQLQRERAGELGLLTALELSCREVAPGCGDGTALAMMLQCSGLMEVASVDLRATFMIPEVHPQLAVLLRAWWSALGIDPGRLRADIVEVRRRVNATELGRIASVFIHLPATPLRSPDWSRLDLTDPALAPRSLLQWMKLPRQTPMVLAEQILFAQPAFINAILDELAEPNRYLLIWLSRVGARLADARIRSRIRSILTGEWPPGAHHLLELLDDDLLRDQEMRVRLVDALSSDDSAVVEAAASAALRTDPIDPSVVEASHAAFNRWTARGRKTTEIIGSRGLEMESVEPTPRGVLALLVVLGPSERGRELLDDDDHEVRAVALRVIRTTAASAEDLEVVTRSARAAELVSAMIHVRPLRNIEIEWILRTVRRTDIPEATRLALIDALAEPAPDAVPDEAAQSTLHSLCQDDSAAIRDRALIGLRLRMASR